MKEKILRITIYIAGSICLFAFFAVRFQPVFNALLKEPIITGYWDKTRYGELYYFSMVSHFREKGLPPAQRKFEYSSKQASIKESDILAFGDSYFEFSRHKQFPEKLADDFGKQVHYVNSDNPLAYLAENDYHDTVPKLVIFERVERYIPISFQREIQLPDTKTGNGSSRFELLRGIKDKIFYSKSEELYDAMLKRSYLTTGIYSLIATLKFDFFGYISKLTPVYLVNDDESWLFYHDEVNNEKTSFYYPFTDEQIDSICNNMADLSRQLKESFNMDLVYLPVPAKYTLYHDILNNDRYNDFLPRLYRGLEQRGVNFVNIYEPFNESKKLLYYRTDEHWNQDGTDLAYYTTLQYLQQNPLLAVYLNKKQDSSLITTEVPYLTSKYISTINRK